MAIHVFNPADWRHHYTNGLTCWCNPEVRTVNKLTGQPYDEPHVIHGACIDPEPEPEAEIAPEPEQPVPAAELTASERVVVEASIESLPEESDVPLPQTADEAIALTMGSPLMHFACFEKIADKENKLIKPVPNRFQLEAFKAYEWCLTHAIPIRLIFVKARQVYGSTGACQLCYHHFRRTRQNALMMADENDRTDKLWAMLERFANNDEFDSYWGNAWSQNSEIAKIEWKDEGGETQNAVFDRETANDPKAGAAGTRGIMWFSEAGLYPKTGVAMDSETIGNAINSMPYREDTLGIIESTADGPTGYFADTAAGAVTLEERMAGKIGNGWIKIFCGWWECDDYRLYKSRATEQWYDDDDPRFAQFKSREEAGRIRWAWTQDQIAWRRMKLVQDLAGNERKFDSDFPDSEEAAFTASGSNALDPEGLAVLRTMACNADPMMGELVAHNRGNIVFAPTVREQATVWIWEQPFVGGRYLVTVDPMSGKSDVTGAGEKDRHSVLMIRDAYTDAFGKLHQVKVVARVAPPNQWDDKVIARWTALLAKYYGNCTVVVEGNYGGGIIEELRDEYSVNLMKRPVFNKTTQRTEERLGWWTDKVSKRVMVGELQDYVREQKIEVLCKHAIGEFATLIVDKDGSVKASGKNHDDDPMALAMGLACLDGATKYTEPRVPKPKAPDHRRWKPVNSWT